MDDQARRDLFLLVLGVELLVIGTAPWWLLGPLGVSFQWFGYLFGFMTVGLVGFFAMILGVVFSMEHALLVRERTSRGVAEAYGFCGTLVSVLGAFIEIAEMLLGLGICLVLFLVTVLSFLGLFMGLQGLRIKWNPWVLSALVLSIDVILVQFLYMLFGGTL